MLATGECEGLCLVWDGSYVTGAYSDVQYQTLHADARAGSLMDLGAQGVIWLTLCKQKFSTMNDHNQLRNAPCSFYTDTTKVVHVVVSTGN